MKRRKDHEEIYAGASFWAIGNVKKISATVRKRRVPPLSLITSDVKTS
jgi:hypothetical protein